MRVGELIDNICEFFEIYINFNDRLPSSFSGGFGNADEHGGKYQVQLCTLGGSQAMLQLTSE